MQYKGSDQTWKLWRTATLTTKRAWSFQREDSVCVSKPILRPTCFNAKRDTESYTQSERIYIHRILWKLKKCLQRCPCYLHLHIIHFCHKSIPPVYCSAGCHRNSWPQSLCPCTSHWRGKLWTQVLQSLASCWTLQAEHTTWAACPWTIQTYGRESHMRTVSLVLFLWCCSYIQNDISSKRSNVILWDVDWACVNFGRLPCFSLCDRNMKAEC